MFKEEIDKIVLAFKNSARIIKNAGADAIQLHGHEGYLLDQFTSPLWNKRKDEYGGSLENRLRFSKELICAIKEGAGSDFPIIYRFGLSHFIDGGRSIDEGVEMAQLLESYGVDALDIDAGCYENWYLPHPPSTISCGSFAYLAEKVKKVVSIPVISSGRIGYPEVAEMILENNQADFVCLGRPLIADPHWGEKARTGNSDAIRPCLACHEGCLKRLMLHKSLSCAVNPMAGNEAFLKITHADELKNVLIVGGGIAGMVAAITSAKRGHFVTLLEKESSLGGNLKLEYIPDFKDDYKRYVKYLIRQLKDNDVEVYLNHIFKIDNLERYNADLIFNAVGAQFNPLLIEGIAPSLFVNPFSLYKSINYSEQVIIIVGGGLIGVEAAINVSSHGGKAILIEREFSVAQLSYRANREHLLLLLNQYSVDVYLNAEVISADGNIMRIKNWLTNDFSELTFDKISICTGMHPNITGLENLENVVTLGDAIQADNVMNAVWTAYRTARLV